MTPCIASNFGLCHCRPLEIPQGTKLTWTAAWDNSADNPRNSDAIKEVGWGLQTWGEMQNAWMEVVWTK